MKNSTDLSYQTQPLMLPMTKPCMHTNKLVHLGIRSFWCLGGSRLCGPYMCRNPFLMVSYLFLAVMNTDTKNISSPDKESLFLGRQENTMSQLLASRSVKINMNSHFYFGALLRSLSELVHIKQYH